jgi:hypothetical protein
VGWRLLIVLRQRRSHACAHSQLLGRCRTGRRCGRASRAGIAMIVRRRVAPRATACAMAPHRTQAELAPNLPGQVRQWPIDEIGEHGLDDPVAAVGGYRRR